MKRDFYGQSRLHFFTPFEFDDDDDSPSTSIVWNRFVNSSANRQPNIKITYFVEFLSSPMHKLERLEWGCANNKYMRKYWTSKKKSERKKVIEKVYRT